MWIRLAAEFHLDLAYLGGKELLWRNPGEMVSRCLLIIEPDDQRQRALFDKGEHDGFIDTNA